MTNDRRRELHDSWFDSYDASYVESREELEALAQTFIRSGADADETWAEADEIADDLGL